MLGMSCGTGELVVFQTNFWQGKTQKGGGVSKRTKKGVVK